MSNPIGKILFILDFLNCNLSYKLIILKIIVPILNTKYSVSYILCIKRKKSAQKFGPMIWFTIKPFGFIQNLTIFINSKNMFYFKFL